MSITAVIFLLVLLAAFVVIPVVMIVRALTEGSRYHFLFDTDILSGGRAVSEEKARVLCKMAREMRLPADGMFRSQTYITDRMYQKYLRRHPELLVDHPELEYE